MFKHITPDLQLKETLTELERIVCLIVIVT